MNEKALLQHRCGACSNQNQVLFWGLRQHALWQRHMRCHCCRESPHIRSIRVSMHRSYTMKTRIVVH